MKLSRVVTLVAWIMAILLFVTSLLLYMSKPADAAVAKPTPTASAGGFVPLVWSDCRAGAACFFQHYNGGGALEMVYPPSNNQPGCRALNYMRDQATSFLNLTNREVFVYKTSNCIGDYIRYRQGERQANYALNTLTWNDDIASAYFTAP